MREGGPIPFCCSTFSIAEKTAPINCIGSTFEVELPLVLEVVPLFVSDVVCALVEVASVVVCALVLFVLPDVELDPSEEDEEDVELELSEEVELEPDSNSCSTL